MLAMDNFKKFQGHCHIWKGPPLNYIPTNNTSSKTQGRQSHMVMFDPQLFPHVHSECTHNLAPTSRELPVPRALSHSSHHGRKVIPMEFQTMTASPEDDENSSNDETGTAAPDELRTYIIIVNDDGSLSLDPNGIIADDADPQTVFPVSLPVNKMKSPDCPLPGATPVPGTSRNRKSKPQAVLYGGENDGVYELNPVSDFTQSKSEGFHEMLPINGTGVDPSATGNVGGAVPGTAIDIDQLGPQDIAILENVLQSESARELLENLALPAEDIPAPAPVISSHLWDHSYSTLSANIPTPPFVNISQPPTTVVEPVKKPIEPIAKPSKSIIKVSFSGSNNAAKPSSPVQPIPRVSPAPLSPVTSTSPSLRRISEGEAAGNIRRSQRQQDRIERQEAERIMAENQQMMQREKELMLENSAPSATPIVKLPESPLPVINILPAVVSPQIPEETRVASPSILAQQPAPTASPEDSPRPERRPTRQRKLPAHLADPNYIQFEDDAKPNVAETPKKPVEPEPKQDDVESMDEEADEEAVEDDDPNKLWCICRQPHNNRFMICCDKCDDWFHGKCVGITKAQAKKMETANLPWHCPTCKKAIKQEQQSASTPKLKISARTSGRRGSETSRGSIETKVVKAAEAQKPVSSEEPSKRRDSISKTVGRRKSESVSIQQELSGDESGTLQDCIVCGKKSRKDSVFCSDGCISQRANATAKSKEKDTPVSGTPPPTTPIPQSPASQKLKRLNSIKAEQEKEKVASFFDFHVIQAGAPKSTEVVPAKQKEATTPQVKLSPITTTPTSVAEKSVPKTPTSPSKSVPPPSIQSSKVASSSGSSNTAKLVTPKSTERKDKASPTPTKDKTVESKVPTPKSSKSPSSSNEKAPKEKKKVGKESPKEADTKERDPKIGKESEALLKNNIRKALRETLKTRLKDLSEAELTLFPQENSPDSIAEKIEEELANLYGSTLNAKYKTKYRSIYFNLKDGKNFLFREILQGTLSPKNLVKMESSDMASAELAEWRNRENQKNLDMIKRAEIDKLVEAKKQALIDKGAEIDAVVAEEQGRKLDISDIIQTNEMSSENTGESDGGGGSTTSKASGKSHSSSSHHRKDKKHEKHSKDSKHNKESKHRHSSSKDRDRRDSESSNSNKDRRSERHRHRSKDQDSGEKLRIKDKDSDSSVSKYKDKSKSSSKDSVREEIRKQRESKSGRDSDSNKEDSKTIQKSDSVEKTVHRDISEENSPSSVSNQSFIDSSSQSKPEDTKYGVRQSVDSEQELPSSTIKTPDFTEDKKEKGEAPVFRTKLMMHELGHFRASAYHVSHNSLQGIFFPESPVPIVGRISPETVWDYLDKMKKTKEVIVLRLAPETEVDNEGYMTFFSYLSSRGRLGVMGGITHPLKDVYLIPLDKHSPVNRALLPFRGPGLPIDRTHCLLAVVTRHIIEIPAVVQSKRKTSSASPDISIPSLKKKRITGGDQQQQQSPTSSGSPAKVSPPTKSVGEISTTDATGALTDPRKKKPVADTKVVAIEENKDNDDDDDQPYTPWEEEDEKDPEEMDTSDSPSGPTAAEKLTAQKLLEEINRKIQQEKQEIESITVAIKMNENITHIPGLDGDFPTKESSPNPDTGVPFFLKTEPPVTAHNETVPTTSTSTVSESHITTETLETNVTCIGSPADVIIVGESERPKSSPVLNQGVKKRMAGEEDDQAYSPSEVDFSDDEKDVKKVRIPMAGGKTSKEEIYNTLISKKEEEKKDFIPGLDLSEPEESENSQLASTSTGTAPELIELDDEEPPPPGESVATSQSKVLPKPTLDSVFSLPPPNYLSAKPKIQINLATKMSVGVASASSVLSTVASSAKTSLVVATNSSPVPPAEVVNPQLQQSSIFTSVQSPSGVTSVLSSQHQQPSIQRPSLASIPNSPVVPNIPPPGLATLHPVVIPSNLPPPLTAMPPANVPPPGVIVPVFPPTPQQPNTSAPPPGYHPIQRPSLIPAPPLGGVNINFSVPPPTVGMVPVTSIPPLPTLRGMPNLTPRFSPHNNNSSNNNSSPHQQPLGRFRPRFPQGNNPPGSKISPPAHSPPGSSRSNNSASGSSGFGERGRRNFGHAGDKHERNDGSEAQQKPNSYSKGQDRYRNRSYGSRHRSRSRSPARNRSRSRSREKRRHRRYSSRSRSRSPSRSTSRRRSRSRSPQSSSRYSRSKSPPRRFSRSRSPSSSKSRRRKSHSPTPPAGKSSSTVSTSGVAKK
ncbi:unnamed protein product [Allacma fusca]|uniref:Death-inducer obliterator 1 n=1 Tax=Allacma fusca TaxID=39272 RepID=A0A8J2KY11_9HEXA|nr:unnamed protein product [Allacma fusca]